MRTPRAVALAALSSVTLALALPNEAFEWGNPVFGLVALVPLFLALDGTGSYGGSFLVGAVFGGLAHGLSSYWLWFFKDFRFWTLGTTIIAYMAVYGFLGLYLRGVLRRGGLLRPLVFAAVWTLFEWGKSTGFLGYPWGLLAYSWNTVAPAVQIAEATGVYGLSFALALCSASLGELLSPASSPFGRAARVRRGPVALMADRPSEGTRPLALGAALAATALMGSIVAFGYVALAKDRRPRGSFSAVLVQQNVDTWYEGEEAGLEAAVSLAREALASAPAAPDLIVFSESTFLRPWNGNARFYARTPAADPLKPFLARSGAWLLTGLPEVLDRERRLVTNSVALIDGGGRQVGSYAKMHPVPFAEAIPFWEFAPFRAFMRDVVGIEYGYTMGTERVLFELPTKGAGVVRFAAPICFEDAFGPLCRDFVNDGAELLVNLTNDAWSRTRSAETQHFVAARFRCVETRRTLVRSTNGGVSAVVGPDGSVLEALPLFEPCSRLVEVPVYAGERTPYLDYGDWFVAALAAFVAFALALSLSIDILNDKEAKP